MKQNRKRRAQGRQAAFVIFWRTIILMAIFGLILFVPLAFKLYDLMINQHDELQMKATSQQTRDVSVSASRGTIYDTHGETLAVSATVYDVILSPKDINTVTDGLMKELYGEKYASNMSENEIATAKAQIIRDRVELIATELSEILEVDADNIRQRCESTTSQYSLVKKKVESDPETSVRNFIEKNDLESCIYLTANTKRYYPYSTLAAQVIGFVNADNIGTYGLEARYEDILAGAEGRIVTAKNNRGTDLLYYYSDYYDAKDGDSIYLTIDATIQSYCEQTLAEGMEKWMVEYGGWCIAMDPDSGAILGIASSPSYDLNDPSAISDDAAALELEQKRQELQNKVGEGNMTQEEADTAYEEAVSELRFDQWNNKAVNNAYEPGSTFKSIVLAAALEEGVISEEDFFGCTGVTEIDVWKIRCSARSGHGTQTLAAAVGNSCNMAFIEIGQRLGGEKFFDYLEAFGITERTGIDLPAEGISRTFTKDELSGYIGLTNLAVSSFGQRFTVNPIQLITAVSATINGGYLYQPHILKSIVDAEGNVIESNEATVVRQVISEETSEIVRRMLEGVVTDYTGANAYQAGYRIGGKTGTSQTNDDDRDVVSFVGFAPADDPQIVVLLAFDGPEVDVKGVNSSNGKCGTYISGGKMAAPLAGQLIADICDYLGVDKQFTSEEEATADSITPSVVGLTEEEAATAIAGSSLTYRVVGDGEYVTGQVPVAGISLSAGSRVVLYMGEDIPNETVVVPDLAGYDRTNAEYALEVLGLFYKGTGRTGTSAQVDSQSIAPGTEVAKGTVVTVHFSDTSVADVD